MAGVITQSAIKFTRLTDVMKHQDAASHYALAVTNRRCGTFDIELIAVTTNQQRRSHGLDSPVAANSNGQRVFQGLTGFLVEATENLINGTPAGIVHFPPG